MNDTENQVNPSPYLEPSLAGVSAETVTLRARRRRLALWVVMLAVFAVVFYESPSGPPVGWGDDLTIAMTEAKSSGRPVVVAFHGAHCPPCHVMDRAVLGKPAVQKELAKFVPVRIDPEQHAEAARRYQVYATPAYTVLTPDGEVVHQIIGSRNVEEFVAFLETALAMEPTPQSPGA